MDQSAPVWYEVGMRTLAAVVLLGLTACGSRKVTWVPHDAGPIVVEFPCAPKTSGVAVKCMRTDGSEYALRTVDKGLPLDAELAEARDYVREIPKGEVFEDAAFPLKWREVRQFHTIDFQMYYADGKELTLSVQYPTPPAPKETAEFFARAKPKAP